MASMTGIPLIRPPYAPLHSNLIVRSMTIEIQRSCFDHGAKSIKRVAKKIVCASRGPSFRAQPSASASGLRGTSGQIRRFLPIPLRNH